MIVLQNDLNNYPEKGSSESCSLFRILTFVFRGSREEAKVVFIADAAYNKSKNDGKDG